VTMERARQQLLAVEFGRRHASGPIIVLPNAFDVATARIIARHGPVAIGTTSGAIAAGLGYRDGEHAPRNEMLDGVARIVDAVDIGVTADIEAGYGDDDGAITATVDRVLELGVIGINLQDTGHPNGRWRDRMLPRDRAVEKIAAARAAADAAGVALVINARTDTFLDPDVDPVEEAIARGNAYLAAGADCVFTPGIADHDGIARLVAALNGPLNAYAIPGTPNVGELTALGVRRVSVGCGPYQACLALIERATTQLLTEGRYDAFLDEHLPYGEMLALLG
jgi:2-methylisocitrate lyase-like PEP mutase family enzyme